ncbi:MAG: autotransporter outer membrane beta-barrel domain-containing protein [Alphaproteobacteria bacterium]|nr:autotransporter outer membrane beta-barrel domain-containing protein [Alphaproteobacteria bacterium]
MRRGRAKPARQAKPRPLLFQPQLRHADRLSLLRGTALASTLLLAGLLAPAPAHATVDCQAGAPAPPNPIFENVADSIVCVNNDPRNGAAYAIYLYTNAPDGYIELFNSGDLVTNNVNYTNGIFAVSEGAANVRSFIGIENRGDITVTSETGNATGIFTFTRADDSPIAVLNTGDIVATTEGLATSFGISAATAGDRSPVSIENSGEIHSNGGILVFGLLGQTTGYDSPVSIVNEGDITGVGGIIRSSGIEANSYRSRSPISVVNGGGIYWFSTDASTFGINVVTNGIGNVDSPVSIVNGGDIISRTTGPYGAAFGIYARTNGPINNPISIVNGGDITALSRNRDATGIFGETRGDDSPLFIVNSGNIRTRGGGVYSLLNGGIFGDAFGSNSPVIIHNSGDINSSGPQNAFGIFGRVAGTGFVDILNSGDIEVDGGAGYALGIRGLVDGLSGPLSIRNRGNIITYGTYTLGISAQTFNADSPVTIRNSGHLTSRGLGANGQAAGILVNSFGGASSPIGLRNSGDIKVESSLIAAGIVVNVDDASTDIFNRGNLDVAGGLGIGILANSFGGRLRIENHGDINVQGRELAAGILALTEGAGQPLRIVNSADIRAVATNGPGVGIFASTNDVNSPLVIVNSGSVFGAGGGDYLFYGGPGAGIYADSLTGTTVVNSGYISSGTYRAIDINGATALVYNTGLIRGFVDLTDENDTFINRRGGTFEALLTSNFGDGDDLFVNEQGGTVLVTPKSHETVLNLTRFIGLERFDNRGLISMQNGLVGDAFRISNNPGPANDYFYNGGIVFNASGGSTLAVDSFLGGPGSRSDIFIIDGDVKGKTLVTVNNTNFGGGSFNPEGIPVVFVGGKVKANAFFLPEPIDAGLVDYDLFFQRVNSGLFELRSFPGGGALLLPQLITATQDIWHQGSSTWFDRSADLRVLLAGGTSPMAYDPNGGYVDGAAVGPTSFTPAVWARGSGAWLDRDGSETVNAFGRNYTYDLSRDLDVLDWQMGLDLGHRDLLAPGDILVFGVLGGFVGAGLDYDQLARQFDFSGGQIGGYATYLRGGLFVDTLLNAHLLEMDTAALGMPSSLDANTLGLRTDTGYRFGSFNGGAFIEPLATIEVLWSDIDGFINSGNRVSFDDEANVRGRLGLRAGTSYPVWNGTTMEPFVIGSLWGNLSGDNQATLVSNGTIFRFEDNLDDVWGEVSAGVNFFNPSAGTAVFAKLDVTFGDEVDGIGGKAGMRVAW